MLRQRRTTVIRDTAEVHKLFFNFPVFNFTIMIAQRLHKLLTQMDICEIEASMAIHQLIMALKHYFWYESDFICGILIHLQSIIHNTNCWHTPLECFLNLDSMMKDLFWGLLQNMIASVPIHQLIIVKRRHDRDRQMRSGRSSSRYQNLSGLAVEHQSITSIIAFSQMQAEELNIETMNPYACNDRRTCRKMKQNPYLSKHATLRKTFLLLCCSVPRSYSVCPTTGVELFPKTLVPKLRIK